jgi:hypothetical protein
MTSASFSVPIATPEAVVEVYDSTLRLVARLLSKTERAELAPGHYHALASAPGADTLHASFDLGDEALIVALASRGGPRLRADSVLDVEDDRQPALSPFLVPLRGEHAELFLFGREITWMLPSAAQTAPGRWVDLRLQTRDGPDQCCILPRGAWPHLLTGVRIEDDLSSTLSVRLKHRTARGLLNYMSHGRFTHADVLSRSRSIEVEQLLFNDATHDPVAASAAALTLIMLGEFDRLEGWTEDLSARFAWLPDGLVADAERRARIGRHEEAAEQLAGLLVRGLPCLTSALTIATSRIRTYVDASFGPARLRGLLDDLSRYAIACDLTADITTFIAETPWNPLPRGTATAH